MESEPFWEAADVYFFSLFHLSFSSGGSLLLCRCPAPLLAFPGTAVSPTGDRAGEVESLPQPSAALGISLIVFLSAQPELWSYSVRATVTFFVYFEDFPGDGSVLNEHVVNETRGFILCVSTANRWRCAG